MNTKLRLRSLLISSPCIFKICLERAENFKIGKCQLLTTVWDVACTMRWLDLANCQCAFVRNTSNEQRFAVFGFAAGESMAGNIGAGAGQPLAGSFAQDFVFGVGMFTTAPGDVAHAM
jgi:hypothetical protein